MKTYSINQFCENNNLKIGNNIIKTTNTNTAYITLIDVINNSNKRMYFTSQESKDIKDVSKVKVENIKIVPFFNSQGVVCYRAVRQKTLDKANEITTESNTPSSIEENKVKIIENSRKYSPKTENEEETLSIIDNNKHIPNIPVLDLNNQTIKLKKIVKDRK